MAGFSIEIIEPQQDKQQPIELQKLGPSGRSATAIKSVHLIFSLKKNVELQHPVVATDSPSKEYCLLVI